MKDALQRLCLACGLCCDGSIFEVVALSGAEAERLSTQGVRLTVRRGGTVLVQPCAALEGTCCRLYAQRPQGCRAFECLVLRRLSNGGLDESEALRVVREARAHVEEVGRAFAVPAGSPVLGHARRAVGEPTVKVSMEAAELLRRAEAFVREHLLGT